MDRNNAKARKSQSSRTSLSARRAWIEIIKFVNLRVLDGSLSARRAWIEISEYRSNSICLCVALRKESVDRNWVHLEMSASHPVALRKESVDRNYYSDKDADWVRVALRKESVDRNIIWITTIDCIIGRSPQGERG